MELVNELYAFSDRRGVRPTGQEGAPPPAVDRAETAAVLREAVEALVLMLSPFTPHLAEELWEHLGHAEGVVTAGWPALDEAATREEAIEVPVQVNGKVRTRVTLPAGASEDEMRSAALAAAPVQAYLEGTELVRVVVAGGRLVNVVVRPKKG
jgi:leucyl-tRNA synthetase